MKVGSRSPIRRGREGTWIAKRRGGRQRFWGGRGRLTTAREWGGVIRQKKRLIAKVKSLVLNHLTTLEAAGEGRERGNVTLRLTCRGRTRLERQPPRSGCVRPQSPRPGSRQPCINICVFVLGSNSSRAAATLLYVLVLPCPDARAPRCNESQGAERLGRLWGGGVEGGNVVILFPSTVLKAKTRARLATRIIGCW